MLTPEYLQKIPNSMVKLYAQAEQDILRDMARRIDTYDYWIPAVEHQAKMLEEMGATREYIIKRLAEGTYKTNKELQSLMSSAVGESLKSDTEIYKKAGLTPKNASEALKQKLNEGFKRTAGEFKNLTKTTAVSTSKQLVKVLDRAYMQILTGGFDSKTAIRNAIKELSRTGISAIEYPNGRVYSLDTVVRRAVITGINQTALKCQEALADEMDCDLVEVSAHAGARPSHAEWQGEIYSRSGKAEKYSDFASSTGYGTGEGLGGWNCSHSFSPYFEGFPRAYTKEMLEDYKSNDIIYNGKRMTKYEVGQKQRNIESSLRRWRREKEALEAVGLDISKSSGKIREWEARERDLIRQVQPSKLLNEQEETAINRYIGGESYIINEKLRQGLELTKAEELWVSNLNSALDKMPKYEGLVQRSILIDDAELEKFIKIYSETDDLIEHKAFSSFGKKVYSKSFNVQMYVESKKGSDISSINKAEKEVLYPTNTKFKVRDYELKNGVLHIWLKEE